MIGTQFYENGKWVCLTAVASAKTSGKMTTRFDSTNDEEREKASSSVAVFCFL